MFNVKPMATTYSVAKFWEATIITTEKKLNSVITFFQVVFRSFFVQIYNDLHLHSLTI